jgi:hypothetical protein
LFCDRILFEVQIEPRLRMSKTHHSPSSPKPSPAMRYT